jgi:hypothetical protein
MTRKQSAGQDGATRPRRGLSFEAALERWSPKWDFAALQEVDDFVRAPLHFLMGPHDARRYEYLTRRARLEKALFGRLASCEFLSTATQEAPDPQQPRFFVHPAFYDADPSYDRLKRRVEAGERMLYEVEIFAPDELPINVPPLPGWLRNYGLGRLLEAPEPPAAVERPQRPSGIETFWHGPGYAHVTIRGIEFSLNPTQAGIVRVLHMAALEGHRWVHIEELRQKVAFNYSKLWGAFRYIKEPSWRELIASDGRGHYRLNV